MLGRAPANVSEGETIHVTLADLTPTAVANAAEGTGNSTDVPEPPSRLGRRLGISLAAIAVVGAVVAIVLTAPYGTPGGQLDGDVGTLRIGE